MSSIDERVVSMQFDNKQFESGVATSMSTLDKLKAKLSMTETAKGFEDLGKAAGKLDFSNLSINIDGVTAKFTAFQSFVHGIFESLGNDVYNFGKRLVSSLTIDQISSGWSKYGEMATSVASIIAATGQSQETTYQQLDKLNWFSDATSYSLTQMTGAYSKFAAAGVEAEDSMKAIMGLATASSRAGISASDSRFNNVLYNVAQAMGMGYLGTMDWKSLELAGIATVEFKQKLIDVGVELGELKKEGDKVFTQKGAEVTAENLRETLSEKWVNKDVMLGGFGAFGSFVDTVYQEATSKGITAEEAMRNLADQSEDLGYKAFRSAQETKTWAEAVDATKDAVSTLWMAIFQDVIGNYEEAKEVWGSVAEALYNTFAEPLAKVERVLSKWKAKGGRALLLEGLSNAFESIGSVIGAVKEGLKTLFPNLGQWKVAAYRLTEITRSFRDWTEALKPSESTLNKITRTFKGFAAIIDIVKTVASAVWKVVSELFGTMTSGHKSILDVTAAFGDWLVGVAEAIKNSEKLQAAVQKVVDVLKPLAEWLSEVINNFWSRFLTSGGGIEGIINGLFGTLLDFMGALAGTFEEITGWDLSGLLSGVYDVVTWLRDKVVDLVTWISGGGKDFSIWETLKNIFKEIGEFLQPIVEGLGNFFGDTIGKVKEFVKNLDFSGVLEKVKSAAEWVGQALKTVWEWIKKLAEKVKELDFSDITSLLGGAAVGGAGLGIWQLVGTIKDFISGLKEAKGGEKAGGIKEFLGGIKDAITDFSESLQKSVNVNMILKVAAAVMTLAIAVKMVSGIDPGALAVSLGAVSTLLGEVVTSLYAFSKFDVSGSLNKAATGMLILSIAVTVLAGAVKSLSELTWEQLAKGIASVTVLLAELAGVTQITKAEDLIATGIGLLAISEAVKILSSAAEVFATLTWEQLGKAGASITVLLAALAGFTQITNAKDLIATGLGIIEVSLALKMLAGVAEAFGNMEWEELGKAGAAIVVLLAALGGFTRLVDPKGMIAVGLAMIELGAAFKIFNGVAESFGNMDWEELGKAGAAIAGIMAIIAAFSVVVSKFGGGGGSLLVMGVGLIAVAAGLKIVVSAVAELATIPLPELVKGIAALGAVLLEISVAMVIAQSSLLGAAGILVVAIALNALLPPLLILSAMSWEGIAKGLVGLGGALAIVVAAAALATAVLPGLLALSLALPLIGVGLVAVGAGLTAIGAAVAAFSAMGIGAIETFVAGIELVIATILTMIPNLATALAASIVLFVVTLGQGAAQILDAVVALGSAILSALITLVPQIVELVITTLSAILEGLITLVPQVIALVSEILLGILELLIEAVPKFIELIFAALTEIINGLTEFVPEVVELVVSTVEAIIAGIAELIPTVIDLFLQMITGILQAVADNLPDLIQSGVDIVVAYMEGIGSAVPQLIDAGFKMIIDFINGLAQALEDNTETLLTATDRLFTAVINAGIAVLKHSVANFLGLGKTIMDSGLIQGIKDKWETLKMTVSTAITKAKQAITEKLSQWLEAGKSLFSNIIDGIKKKWTDLKTAVTNLISDAKEAIVNTVSDWVQAGKDMISGFIEGVKAKAASLLESAKSVVSGAVNGVKRFLKIGSPSKLLEQYGIWTDQGYINGILKLKDKVAGTTEDMAEGAVNAFTDIMDGSFNADDIGDPVIRPIMDLTEIQNGRNAIDGILNGDYSLGGSLGIASAASSSMSGKVDLTQQAIDRLQLAINRLSGQQGVVNNNTFNIESNDPEAVANAVSDILQHNVERTNAQWA